MKFLAILILFFTCIKISAGPIIIGNGGNSVLIDGKMYLLDLVENASAFDPQFSNLTKPYFENQVEQHLALFDPHVRQLVIQKLSELSDLDSVYAETLLRAMSAIHWKFVNYRLDSIPVESAVAGKKFQVAIRTDEVILIDIHYWNMLDYKNQAALLFHEANYILIAPEKNAKNELFKSPYKSRLMTGLLFSTDLKKYTAKNFWKRLTPLFPMSSDIQNFHTPIVTEHDEHLLGFNPVIKSNDGTYSVLGTTQNNLTKKLCDSLTRRTYVLILFDTYEIVLHQSNNNQQDSIYRTTVFSNFSYLWDMSLSCRENVAELSSKMRVSYPGIITL